MRINTTATKKGRISIFADGEFMFTVPALMWYTCGISENEEITEESLGELRAESEAEDAFEKAVRLLSVRDHGEKELFGKLRLSFPEKAAEAAVNRCMEKRLIDDAEFSAKLAEELYRKKNFSPERIEKELKARGIDSETAKNAAESLDIDRNSGIINIINKMRLPEEPSQAQINKLMRRLTAAGYSISEIRNAVRTYTEENC